MQRSLWCLVVLTGLACSFAARADELNESDARGIRSVIEAQIAAFKEDDASRAFSYAAPSIRQQAGTPERFVEMVRTNYPVVYRPSSVKFLQVTVVGGEVFQAVQMLDGNGVLWLALYAVQRQPDKLWRISGCVVRQSEDRVI